MKKLPQDYETQIKTLLSASELTEEMKNELKMWKESLHRIKLSSMLNYLTMIKVFGRWLLGKGKERFGDATKLDIDAYLTQVENRTTYNNHLTCIKRFYKDFGMEEIVEDLKPKKEDLKPIPPSQLLLLDEVVALANKTGSEMRKALTLTLYEASARIQAEVLELRVGDVEFSSVRDKEGKRNLIAILYFGNSKGEVKKEPVTLTMFAGELKRWVEAHPSKNNPQAWLFPSELNPENHISYFTVWAFLRRAKKKAGINKRVNPHWFRHSGLSFCANELNYNEQLLMWRAGWKNTQMAKRYIHSGGELERKAYLERMGYRIEEGKKEVIKPKPCPHCNALNPFTNNNCDFCGMPLSLEQYKKELEKRRRIEAYAGNLEQIYKGELTEEQKAEIGKHIDIINQLSPEHAKLYLQTLLETWVKSFMGK